MTTKYWNVLGISWDGGGSTAIFRVSWLGFKYEKLGAIRAWSWLGFTLISADWGQWKVSSRKHLFV